MPDWQERITRETAPAIRAEHELRYRVVAPIVRTSDAWVDLGCGNGLAAAVAFAEGMPPRALVADFEPEAVAEAAATLSLSDADAIVADLTQPRDLERIADALAPVEGHAVITCFEVVEHLATFLPLLEWSSDLVRRRAATFVLSVPNDAFWSVKNPHHKTAWGEGAFDELRDLIPTEHTLLRQVALSGSAMIDWDASPLRQPLDVPVGGDGSVTTHFIAAYGARHEELQTGALAVQTDLNEQRRWERQRESSAAVAQHLADAQREAIEAQDVTIAEQREELRSHTKQFDEWRVYIRELETELERLRAQPAASEAPNDER
jgi:SAM-dependent methyltransferase